MMSTRPCTTLLPALLALAAGACASSQPVRPLGRGRTALNVSAGGPLIRAVGVDLPTPILTIAGARGMRDDLEVTGRFDATAAAFGVAHLAPGVAYHPIVHDSGWTPTVTVAGTLHLLTDFQALRAAPMSAATAAWVLGGRHVVYAGADLGLAFGSPTRLILGPLVGGELRLGNVGLGLEGKWLAPYHDVGPAAPDWLSPGDRGYLSLLLGFNYYFEGPRRW